MTTELTGIFSKDRLKMVESNYQYIGGLNMGTFLHERIREIPNGAYVRLSFEVLDPHPEKSVSS